MWSSEMILIVCVVFILAGFVKGVTGFGLPIIAVALLTATIGLKEAMVLTILPAILINIWQATAGGHLRMLLQRLWPFLLSVCIAIWFSVRLIAVVDVFWLSTLLGLVLAIYALFGLLSIHLPAPGKHESWLGPLAGGINGVIAGLTAMYVVPGAPYFQSLGLQRDALIQAMGVLFLVCSVTLGLALQNNQLFSAEYGSLSVVALIPVFIGMALGQRIRKRISETQFKRIFFFSLLLLGIYIILKSWI